MTNQVVCDDAIKVMKALPDNSIHLILSDPPYGISYQSQMRLTPFNPIQYDEDFPRNLMVDFFRQAFRVLKRDSHCYVFTRFDVYHHLIKCASMGIAVNQVLIWDKGRGGMGGLEDQYAPAHEWIVFFEKGNRKLNPPRIPDVLHFDRVENMVHPTEKPVPLLIELIRHSSNEGDTLLDPFCGSGSTGVAAVRLKRNCILSDLEEKYCEIARKRVESEEKQLNLKEMEVGNDLDEMIRRQQENMGVPKTRLTDY